MANYFPFTFEKKQELPQNKQLSEQRAFIKFLFWMFLLKSSSVQLALAKHLVVSLPLLLLDTKTCDVDCGTFAKVQLLTNFKWKNPPHFSALQTQNPAFLISAFIWISMYLESNHWSQPETFGVRVCFIGVPASRCSWATATSYQ